MSARTSSSRSFIVSSPTGHATSTLDERLRHVLLDHARRYLQTFRDLLVAQPLHILQHDRRVALRWQSAEHGTQPLDLLVCENLSLESRALGELLLNRRVFDINGYAAPPIRTKMLFGKIARDRVKVRLGIADRRYVFYPEHPQINLLREITGVCALSNAPVEECLERPAVRREQSL